MSTVPRQAVRAGCRQEQIGWSRAAGETVACAVQVFCVWQCGGVDAWILTGACGWQPLRCWLVLQAGCWR
jgi:hypothetical protein